MSRYLHRSEGELYDGSARGWFTNDAITFDVVGEGVSGEQQDGATSEEHAAAITIQSYYRGTQARKASKKLREANAARTTPVKTATAEEHAAATKIQAGFRGLQARRKSAKLRSKPLVTHPQPPTITPPKVIVSEDQQEMPSSQTGLKGADVEATAVQAEYESAVSSTDAPSSDSLMGPATEVAMDKVSIAQETYDAAEEPVMNDQAKHLSDIDVSVSVAPGLNLNVNDDVNAHAADYEWRGGDDWPDEHGHGWQEELQDDGVYREEGSFYEDVHDGVVEQNDVNAGGHYMGNELEPNWETYVTSTRNVYPS